MRKTIITIAIAVFFISNAHAQTFRLTVNNGYASATTFRAGDTLHLWSVAFDSTRVFVNWTGDTAGIAKAGEWHTTLIAPARNIILTANLRSVNPYSVAYEKIKGKNNLKNVYYFFPAAMKGVIYCLHGTSGHAVNWITSLEYRQFVNAAIADSFGVLITEAEEITLNTDLNADGKLRWSTYPADSVNNVDYANIKAITDTFITRGKMSRSTPRFSVGMSNGGAFSAALSMYYKYAAGVSYCAPAGAGVVNYTGTPLQFCMAKYDDNENVGPQGNADALTNYNTLVSRGICTAFNLHDHSPCYPQRFARIAGVSTTASQNIFNEFVAKGFLDARNFFIISSDTIAVRIQNNPLSYPAIIALTAIQRLEIISQIAAMNAAHQFYSDLNNTTLNFLRSPCGSINAVITAGSPLTFCAGGSVTLTANSGTGYSYQWFKNNVIINGAISQNYTANASGSYTVKITGTNGLAAVSNGLTVTVNPLPVPQITPATASICPGSSISLSTTVPFTSYVWSTGATSQSIVVTAAGTFTVTVSNTSGCMGTASVTVTLTSGCNAPSDLFASAVSTSSATLNWAAAGCAYSYKLQYRKAGTTVWTNTSISPPAVFKTLTGLAASTTYQWKIRTMCSSGTGNQSPWSAIQSFTTTTSIGGRFISQSSVPVGNEFSIYPNPASDQLNISLPPGNYFSVEIINASGKTILKNQDEKKINISQLPAGIYFVKITTGSEFYSQKFIKQ